MLTSYNMLWVKSINLEWKGNFKEKNACNVTQRYDQK